MALLTAKDKEILKDITESQLDAILAMGKRKLAADEFEILWQSIKKNEKCTVEDAMKQAVRLNPDLYDRASKGL
jgi:hypothetical protein